MIAGELAKVSQADLSVFDKSTNTYFIKKRVDIRFVENQCYLIALDPTLLTDNTLATNWNKGNCPVGQHLLINVCQLLGQMMRVDGVVYNIDKEEGTATSWSGWLPINKVKCIKTI